MNHYVFSVVYMAIFGYFGHLAKLGRKLQATLIILSGIVVNIPFQGISLNMLTYSFLGAMSIFLFALCLIGIFESLKTNPHNPLGLKASIFIFVFGLILFLNVFNLIPINIYYQPPTTLIIICTCLTIIAYFIHKPLGILYLIALLGFGLGVMDSSNPFDYFIDAPTWVFALIYLLFMGSKQLYKLAWVKR
ncbi:hypothetical protein BKH46_06450 [Helicobacter sp. 12S02634-8]|uniref:hypothetical protein n=1 Tax=Helicobacter sp. 12S02634-8 TaxID=1476199 RepID=UPI000BA594BA|nr:hypothetical protein [Helicobacter sp. 12S02634-8]PAF46850.1 hypothetical protein BKH46_06450 [Helicobacter sp. 12S02634-8]